MSTSRSRTASGEQARAVKAGLEADLVALSTRSGRRQFRQGRPRLQGLDEEALQGMVTNSVVVFILRDGNPKKIRSWTDLLKPGSRS